jgi:hypothetical protein
MLRNYFTIAVRNLFKNKAYAALNVVGLSVAFGSAILLFLTAAHEFSFDNFHANGDRIYRLYFQSQPGGAPSKSTAMPAPLTPALAKEFPELEWVVRQAGGSCLIRYGGKEMPQSIKYVDPGFFQMYTLPFRRSPGRPGRRGAQGEAGRPPVRVRKPNGQTSAGQGRRFLESLCRDGRRGRLSAQLQHPLRGGDAL